MRTEDEVGSDFCVIPRNPFIFGGDRETFGSVQRTDAFVDDFAMQKHPVTWHEYAELVRSLLPDDIERARAMLAGILIDGSVRAWTIDDAGELSWASAELEETCPRWPIFNVTFDQALEYIAWRSARDGRRYDLPTTASGRSGARSRWPQISGGRSLRRGILSQRRFS